MNTRQFRILKTIAMFHEMGKADCTIGEVSRWSNIPKSTARRTLEKLINYGLVDCKSIEYKSTNAWAMSLTKLGNSVFKSQKEMF